MTIPEMKGVLQSVYLGPEWKRKVAIMDDGQVVAVFNSFQARGLIGKTVSYEKPKGVERMEEIKDDGFDKYISDTKYVQLTIDDFLPKE